MRFKVDENLPVEVAEVMIGAGYEAATVNAEALQGSPDARIAEICAAENRALITADLGFADIRTYPPQTAPGYIVLRLSRYDKAYVLRVIQDLIPLLKQETVEHHLWIVEDTKVRIRGARE